MKEKIVGLWIFHTIPLFKIKILQEIPNSCCIIFILEKYFFSVLNDNRRIARSRNIARSKNTARSKSIVKNKTQGGTQNAWNLEFAYVFCNYMHLLALNVVPSSHNIHNTVPQKQMCVSQFILLSL